MTLSATVGGGGGGGARGIMKHRNGSHRCLSECRKSPSWDLGPRRYLFGDNSALNKFNQTKLNLIKLTKQSSSSFVIVVVVAVPRHSSFAIVIAVVVVVVVGPLLRLSSLWLSSLIFYLSSLLLSSLVFSC